MSDYKPDYIEYRLSKAYEAFDDAKILAENHSWNACVNRLYYTCYYVVSALLLTNGISTQTHTGLKTQFNLHFIKTGILSKDFGKLYTDLMDWRQKGDYGDMFDFDEEAVKPLLKPVEKFINGIIQRDAAQERNDRNAKKMNNYNILHLNEEVSKKAIELINKYKLSHNLQIPDALIAAMSIVYEIELFTYNKKDFQFLPEIKLYA